VLAVSGCRWVRGQSFKLTGSTAQCGISGLSRPITRITGTEEGLSMSDPIRLFPRQPNLRHLKLEAKRRLAAGEFATLHDAQLAIAREHRLSSWTVLKQLVENWGTPSQATELPTYALDQVRWVIARFAGAGQAGWVAPDDGELREHFTERFLDAIPAAQLISTLSGQAASLQEELEVTAATAQHVQAELPGLQIQASTETDPPHRLTMLRAFPDGRRITDPRLASASSRTDGDVPPVARQIAEATLTNLALPGLVLAASTPDVPALDTPDTPGAPKAPGWILARGWADLDRERALRPDHRFPAYSITKLITAVAVLRLVADGAVRLDAPANGFLRDLQLADPEVTVRDLLTHSAGADTPDILFAQEVPALLALTGPVLGCSGPRGRFDYSNGGYAALGQLIADVSGVPYADAATRLVLRPLAMGDSWYPVRWPDGPDAVTGYGLADQAFRATTGICTLPAAGGLWSTAADLLRFARGWHGLLPAALAAEALRPQLTRPDAGAEMGLGWLVNQERGVHGHAGGGQGGASSLIVQTADNRIHVALTNRLIPIEPVNAKVLTAVS
jgi:CubicO group peptidase (beta-lactamase class C family)